MTESNIFKTTVATQFEFQKQAVEAAERVDGVSDKGERCGSNCMLYNSVNGAPVMTVFHAGGHEYPDGTSETIVKFFKEHSLPH